MHTRRAKAYSFIARVQARGGGDSDSAAPAADADAAAAAADPKATWRRVLQDCNSAVYYDSTASSIPAVFLKCEALQALERYEEAVAEVRYTINVRYRNAK